MNTCTDCKLNPVGKYSKTGRCKVCANRAIANARKIVYNKSYILSHRTIIKTCWEWTGAVNSDGYGIVNRASAGEALIHRLAFKLWNGPIASGLEIDHKCRNRRCINPRHLRAVTHRRNMLMAPHIATQIARTHCPSGHEYTTENTYISPSDNRRHCRKCLRDANKRSRDKKMLGSDPSARRSKPVIRRSSNRPAIR